jgi:hypothetical protein
MNKKIVFGMIALLSVSLFFLGCPTEADSDSPSSSAWPTPDGSPKPPNQAEAAGLRLKADLIGWADSSSDANLSVAADGSVTISGGTLTFTATTVEIPPGVTLKVANDGVLEVPASGTLRVKGTVENSGNIDVAATGTYQIVPGAVINNNNTGRISVSGTYDLNPGASGTNNGRVTVENDGVINSYAHIAGNGENIVKKGGKVYFTAGELITGDSTDTTPSPIFELDTDAQFSYGNGFYSVDAGTVKIKKRVTIDGNLTTLYIAAGATLELASGADLGLEIKNDANNNALRGFGEGTAPKIKVTDGTHWVYRETGQVVNFYYDNGTNVVKDITNVLSGSLPTNKEYSWSDDANGDDTDGDWGWVRTS